MIELQSSEQRVDIDVSQTAPGQFTRRSSRLTLNGFNEKTDVGEYWCQARLENGTTFQERSNVLVLGTRDRFQDLSPCQGSSTVEQRSCICTLQIVELSIASESVIPTTHAPAADSETPGSMSSSDLSPTLQTTDGPTEDTEDTSGSRTALYAIIAAVSAASVGLIVVFVIVVAILRYKQKAAKSRLQKCEKSGSSHPEGVEMRMDHTDHNQPHESQVSSIINPNEAYDSNNNGAYCSHIGRINLDENVSYVTTNTIPADSTSSHDYEEIHMYDSVICMPSRSTNIG